MIFSKPTEGLESFCISETEKPGAKATEISIGSFLRRLLTRFSEKTGLRTIKYIIIVRIIFI
jgi:hypothetical protein